MEPKSPSKSKLHVPPYSTYKKALRVGSVIGFTLMLLLGLSYLALKFNRFHGFSREDYYYFTVVIDCGSTGTRVNVYKWMSRQVLILPDSGSGLPVLVDSYPGNSMRDWVKGNDSCRYHCLQTEPGLDKLVGNASAVRDSLVPLLRRAEQWIPNQNLGETPVFVLGTAGLRRLGSEDIKKVLDDVGTVVREFQFVHKSSWIRVLSGEEEAYYGWVALNYNMERLGNSTGLGTLGLLDLGGSSLQVAVEANDEENGVNLVRLKIGIVEYRVLAYSLPAFGLNEAFERTIKMLSQEQGENLGGSGRYILRHPCLHSNFSRNYTCLGCLGSSGTNQETVHLLGDPNWEECRRVARAAATNSSSSVQSLERASSNGEPDPSFQTGNDILNLTALTIPRSFHALSGFFAVHSKLNLSPRANLTQELEKGYRLCLRSWMDPIYFYDDRNHETQFCFKVLYMTSVIDDALGLGDHNITFGPSDISWTLGAALLSGEFIWLNGRKAKRGTSNFMMPGLYQSIFVFVLLLCLGLVVYYRQIKLPMPRKKGVDAPSVSLPTFYQKRQHN